MLNSGRSNIKKSKQKHKVALNAAVSSRKVNNFIKTNDFSDFTTENVLLVAKEGTFAYHTIKHMQSFRSLVSCNSI